MAGLIEYGIHANLAHTNLEIAVLSPSQVLSRRFEQVELARLATDVLAGWGFTDPEVGAEELASRPRVAHDRLVMT